MMNDLGENLRKLRVKANYSQEYVADRIGVSLSSYSRYERNEIGADFNSVVKLCELYKLTLDEIYNYSNPNFEVNEPKESYLKKWCVPIMVALDGTEETLNVWMLKLAAINKAI